MVLRVSKGHITFKLPEFLQLYSSLRIQERDSRSHWIWLISFSLCMLTFQGQGMLIVLSASDQPGLLMSFQQREIRRLACTKHKSVIFFSLLLNLQSFGYKLRIQSAGQSGTGFKVIWEMHFITSFQNFRISGHSHWQWNKLPFFSTLHVIMLLHEALTHIHLQKECCILARVSV